MSQLTIGIGTVANDGTGDTLRAAFDKINTNFTEVYALIAGMKTSFTAQSGNSFTAPATAINIGFVDSDGKVTKADASAEATCKGQLVLASAAIAADAAGDFVEYGVVITSGLTAGDTYYISETAGAITATRPTDSGTIVRIAGYAQSATRFKFDPDNSYVEN